MLLNADLYWDSWRYLSSLDSDTRVTRFKLRQGDVLELQLRFEIVEVEDWPYGKLNDILSWRFVTPQERERLGLSPKILQLQPFGSLSYICGPVRDYQTTTFQPGKPTVGGKTRLEMLLDCGLPVIAHGLMGGKLVKRIRPRRHVSFFEGVGKLFAEAGFAPRRLLHPVYGELRDICVAEEATPSETPIRVTVEVSPERPAKYIELNLP